MRLRSYVLVIYIGTKFYVRPVLLLELSEENNMLTFVVLLLLFFIGKQLCVRRLDKQESFQGREFRWWLSHLQLSVNIHLRSHNFVCLYIQMLRKHLSIIKSKGSDLYVFIKTVGYHCCEHLINAKTNRWWWLLLLR